MADEFESDNIKGEIEPSFERKFNAAWVKDTIKNITETFFSDFLYLAEEYEQNGVTAVKLARKIRDVLRDSCRMPRYKISVQTYLGEKRDQKVALVAKGFWDNYLDNYATYNYCGDNFYCSVIAWGFYTD